MVVIIFSFWILFCFLPKYYIRISPIEKSNECIHQNSEFAKNSESNLLLRDQLTENVKILNDIQVSFSSDPDDIKRWAEKSCLSWSSKFIQVKKNFLMAGDI